MGAHAGRAAARCPAHPELDPVLRKGLAKEPEDRYATCTELIDAARAAPAARPACAAARAPRAAAAPPRAILAAGLCCSRPRPPRPAILALRRRAARASARRRSATASRQSPGAAERERADRVRGRRRATSRWGRARSGSSTPRRAVVTRIDPETKRVTGTFKPRGIPTDIAAGAGALWIGLGGGPDAQLHGRVARVDPKTRKITHTVKLPDRTGEARWPCSTGASRDRGRRRRRLGASTPTDTISRIDPATGAAWSRRSTSTSTRSRPAGDGVWFARRPGRASASTRGPTSPARGSRSAARSPSAIAVGGGTVWVTAEQEGLLWRIEPGPGPVSAVDRRRGRRRPTSRTAPARSGRPTTSTATSRASTRDERQGHGADRRSAPRRRWRPAPARRG